jgi:hypothetical protein
VALEISIDGISAESIQLIVLLLLDEPPFEHAAKATAVKETMPAANKCLIFIHNPAFSKLKTI